MAVLPALTSCAGQRTILNENGKYKSVSAKLKDVSTADSALQKESVVVWFVKSAGDKFEYVPIKHVYQPKVSFDESQTPLSRSLEAAVSELVSGPSDAEEAQGLGSEVPRGTVLISVVNAKDGKDGGKDGGKDKGMIINLSKHFLAGSGAESFDLRMEQLKRTVNSVVGTANGGEKVFLNVEGERLTEATGDGIDVVQPINQ